MKILYVNKFFFLKGGSETVFFQERNFAEKNGITVIDFSMKDFRNSHSEYSNYFLNGRNYDTRGEKIKNRIKLAFSFIHSTEAIIKLKKLIKIEKPQIAHLHNIYHQITPSIIPLLKNFGAKVILTLHDGKLVCPSYLMLNHEKICTRCQGSKFLNTVRTGCTGSIAKGSLLAIESYWHKWAKSYESVDRFISPSKFLADLVGQYRIDPSKIILLPNGIDLNRYKPEGSDDGYALYFGRVSKEKGIKTLVAAHKQLNPFISLKVVGTGTLQNRLARQHPNIIFLGYKQPKQLLPIIEKASFVVVPSEWYENCSMTVLESMAMSKPVIGSKIGGIPEQVVHGKTGFLYEMGNVNQLLHYMQLLTNDIKLRNQLGAAARMRVEEKFGIDQHCNGLLNIYNDLIAGK